MPSPDISPRVSVVLRTRNRPEMLRDALEDILAQTFDDFEIVLVDDGDSAGVVQEIADGHGDPRIRIVDRTAERHGRAPAANAGIRAARGEFLVLHDDDDAWKPEFLERTVAHLDADPASVAVSARTEIVIHRADGEDRGLLNQGMDAITLPEMLRVNRITTNSLLYRSALHDEIGYIDETLAVLEDWDFYLRLLMRHPIDLLPLPALAEWHHRPTATGDAGNSVYELDSDHEAADAGVRDRYIREALGRSGIGAGLLVAREFAQLEDSLFAEREASARRYDTVIGKLDQVSRELAEVRGLVLERTSVSAFLRRLGRTGRR